MSQSNFTVKSFGAIRVAYPIREGASEFVPVNVSPTASSLTATAVTVTAAQVLKGLLVQTPGAALTLTLPSGLAFVAAISSIGNGVRVGDSFDFSYINSGVGTAAVTLAVDATGSLVGSGACAVASTTTFKFQLTNVTTGAHTVFRL